MNLELPLNLGVDTTAEISDEWDRVEENLMDRDAGKSMDTEFS